ncbi:MAG: VOC family protein [Deltaproteobacteria bacterium]|nr:VOC family protein [Deltaproteobacteria bacterium]
MPAVHHVAVVVSDLARAERFYSGVLGLTVLERHTDDAGAPRSVWLALEGGAFLALERAGLSQPKRDEYAPGWHCVALAITRGARASWRQHLADAGHAVERETPYTLYVRDPDGALVALSHYPEK